MARRPERAEMQAGGNSERVPGILEKCAARSKNRRAVFRWRNPEQPKSLIKRRRRNADLAPASSFRQKSAAAISMLAMSSLVSQSRDMTWPAP
jgi:hypothetical protein